MRKKKLLNKPYKIYTSVRIHPTNYRKFSDKIEQVDLKEIKLVQ